jgi:glycine/D-amino acid oxidase-like deaminating enzyme
MRGSGRPIWDDLATPELLAALDPGVPDDWLDKPDVLVVGGGIAGLAVAVFCRRAGMSVLLVERERLAGGTSGRAAGGLAPDAHFEHGEEWRSLGRSSLALHRELDAEWDYGLRARDILVPPDLRIPDQAHVDPITLASAFARHAGTVASRTACTYTLTSGGRIVTVVTDAGRLQPGAVVFATGVAPPQAPAVRTTLVKGHLVATEPVPFTLDEIVTDGDILIVQLPGGSLVAGGTKDLDDNTDDVVENVVTDIEQRMCELVPQAVGVRVTHSWCCFRPCAVNELPIVDRVPGLTNAWMAAGFYSTGLLMAPIVGRLLAEWISGRRPDALIPFGLDRFP